MAPILLIFPGIAIAKGFFTVPAPEKDSQGYCQGLLAIIKQHNYEQIN